MELREIRYFLTLTQTLNFTKAAQICNVSQPALTRAIRKLEEELGGLLFSRERNNIQLTDLGRLIEPHLAEAAVHTGEVKQKARQFLKLEKAHLSLGVMCTIAPVQFVGFMARFRADNPGIALTLLEDVPDRLCELLAQGKIDIALMATPRGFPPTLSALELYRERFVIACAAGHRFAGRNEISMAELHDEFYLSRINCEFYDEIAGMCRGRGAKLINAYESEREDWILTMVAAGLGICFLPEYTAIFPGIVSCPVTNPALERSVCLASAAGRPSSAPVKIFAEALRRHRWPCSSPSRQAASRVLLSA